MDLRHQALRWFINLGDDTLACAEAAIERGLRSEHLQGYDHPTLAFIRGPEYLLFHQSSQYFDRHGELPGAATLQQWLQTLERGGHIDSNTSGAMAAVLAVLPRYASIPADVIGVADSLIAEYKRGMAYSGVGRVVDRELRHGSPDDIAAGLRRVADDLGVDEGTHGVYSLSDVVESRWQQYVHREENPGSGRGIMLGWPAYDQRNNGVRRGAVLVITANTSVGKSAFQVRSAINAWRLGRHNVLLINQEMNCETQHRRMEAMELSTLLRDQGHSRRLMSELELGELGDDREVYRQLLESYRDNPAQLWMVSPDVYNDLGDLEGTIARLKRKHGLDLVCADNANHQRAPGARAERHDLILGDVIKWMHDIAVRYDVGVITDVQSPPDVADKREVNVYQAVGYSKMIVHHADDVMRLFPLDDAFLEAQMLKSRSGDSGYSFQLYFHGPSMHIEYVNQRDSQ